MDIDVIYKAKDGTRFHDPYECERYENRLGTMPGTVARARVRLKEMGAPDYKFPKQFNKTDVIGIVALIFICLILIVLCMTGVIS